MAELVVEGPDGAVIRVDLGPGPVTLGRDPGCEVTLNDRLVSRRHVTVTPGFIVEDRDSFNGVYVRGKRVQRSFLLPGESFWIGSKGKFEVHLVDERAQAARGMDEAAGMTMAECSGAPRSEDSPQTPVAGPSTHVLDSREFEDRLQALQHETERLARENRQLRQRIQGDTVEPADPGSSAEAAAASSHTMHFDVGGRDRRAPSNPHPRDQH